ncbi:MAG: alpha/beta hydrolase [Thermoanaerobaculales bacterium]
MSSARPYHRYPWKRFAVSALVLCATIAVMLPFLESSMIYYPTVWPDGFWDVEAVARGSGSVIEDCYFSAEDGPRLNAWWCRLSPAEDRGDESMVLLFFHGNAGNLSHRAELVLRLAALPAEVLIVDYRGYGRSEGRPSEAGLYRDARAAWRYLVEERGLSEDRIVIFGKSLGGAVAVDLATRVKAAGLIVESSFTSVPDMAGRHFPFVPRFLIRTRMDSLTKIGTIDSPKLFIHSRSDEIVPYALGRRLFEAAPEPKRFYEVVGAGHNEISLVGGEAYFAVLGEFFAECNPARRESARKRKTRES